MKKILSTLIIAFTMCISLVYANTINHPNIDREFRGVWVATVYNIDWPSQEGLTNQEQKQEINNILDKLQENNINAVMLQVRGQADAFYKSSYEPWSKFLTGVLGKNPGYDPLKYWIKEAHKRGIELHAWINPYRANQFSSLTLKDLPQEAVVQLKPDANLYWLVPTMKEVQEHVKNVIQEIVDNYDIDGIHMDDYFYPYPDDTPTDGFPDQKLYQDYKDNGGKLGVRAWRRDAVNTLIQDLATQIKQSKPYVKFGISPFGIWRPGHPKGIEAGADSFKDLAADSKKWINKGWVDYLSPQLYWPIDQKPQSFETLIEWWLGQNYKNRNIWPGLYTSNEVDKGSVGTDEIIRQIEMTRDKTSNIEELINRSGHVHFSLSPLLKNQQNIMTTLKTKVYEAPTITPVYPNIVSNPERPQLKFNKQARRLSISFNDLSQSIIVLRKIKNKGWNVNYYPAYNKNKIGLYIQKNVEEVEVKVMDRYSNISESSFYYFQQTK